MIIFISKHAILYTKTYKISRFDLGFDLENFRMTFNHQNNVKIGFLAPENLGNEVRHDYIAVKFPKR